MSLTLEIFKARWEKGMSGARHDWRNPAKDCITNRISQSSPFSLFCRFSWKGQYSTTSWEYGGLDLRSKETPKFLKVSSSSCFDVYTYIIHSPYIHYPEFGLLFLQKYATAILKPRVSGFANIFWYDSSNLVILQNFIVEIMHQKEVLVKGLWHYKKIIDMSLSL